MRIFVAGATGAIGLPLMRVLCALGHDVTGMTRSRRGADLLREIGAKVCCIDAFDRQAVRAAVAAAAPDVVIDQLTALPADPANIMECIADDTRLHRQGGGNLVAAALESGVGRYVLQSKGFYLDASGGRLASESARLRYDAPGAIGESARVMGAYEDDILSSPQMDGIVLRYGFFYGPGTWYCPDGGIAEQARRGETLIVGDGKAIWSFVHIDDAVAATVASLTAEPGVYNIVDDDPLPVCELLPAFANWVGAPEPRRVSEHDALTTLRAEVIYYHSSLTGADNLRAKEKLGFAPRPLVWKSHGPTA